MTARTMSDGHKPPEERERTNKYLCLGCLRDSIAITEEPKNIVRAGCDTCGTLQRHVAYHTPAFTRTTKGGRQ